jgi:hypothetical protein
VGSRKMFLPTTTHGEKGESATAVACMDEVSGNIWIPTVVLNEYKGKYRGKEFGGSHNTGNTFRMTPKGYITTEEFCKFLHHFNNQRLSGKAGLILV